MNFVRDVWFKMMVKEFSFWYFIFIGVMMVEKFLVL